MAQDDASRLEEQLSTLSDRIELASWVDVPGSDEGGFLFVRLDGQLYRADWDDDGELTLLRYTREDSGAPDCDACRSGKCIQRVTFKASWVVPVTIHGCQNEVV